MSLQGPIPVEFGTVFPSGAYAAGAFDPVRNFDASTGEKFVQSTDKATGAPLWVIEVIDPDPQATDPGGQGQGRRPGPARRPHRAARLAVRPGGVHRADRHPVREPGRAAGLLAQGNRNPGTRPRPPRTRTTGGGRVRSGGGSFGQISLHVGQDWWTFLNTYDDHSPILDVAAGSTTVTFTIADRKASDSALEFARELASQAAQFAAEVERLHAQHGQDSGTGDAGSGNGEAA